MQIFHIKTSACKLVLFKQKVLYLEKKNKTGTTKFLKISSTLILRISFMLKQILSFTTFNGLIS